MARSIETLATRYKPRLRRKEPRWNDLRRIGNSPIARASVTMPVLGYLILFHKDLLEYLKLHSSFCQNCDVSWRLYMLYFACCCFAVGSLIYAWRCPRIIKSYAVSMDYIETEKAHYYGATNLEYLFELFDREKSPPADPSGLRSKAAAGISLKQEDIPQLSDLMSQFYFIQNRRAFTSRIVVFTMYALGFLLLGIPATWTFLQILMRVAAPR
jgi:hypothetical protein